MTDRSIKTQTPQVRHGIPGKLQMQLDQPHSKVSADDLRRRSEAPNLHSTPEGDVNAQINEKQESQSKKRRKEIHNPTNKQSEHDNTASGTTTRVWSAITTKTCKRWYSSEEAYGVLQQKTGKRIITQCKRWYSSEKAYGAPHTEKLDTQNSHIILLSKLTSDWGRSAVTL